MLLMAGIEDQGLLIGSSPTLLPSLIGNQHQLQGIGENSPLAYPAHSFALNTIPLPGCTSPATAF
jgi:hypothetical protein